MSSAVGSQHDVRVEHRDERIEVTVVRHGEEGVDYFPLTADIAVGGPDVGSSHPAPGPAGKLPRRGRGTTHHGGDLVEWGLAPVNGVFHEVSGYGTVSAEGEVSGTVTVAAASVDTKNTRRDTHLRSADFFDSANHPDITFTANGIRPSGQSVAVTGTLTVRDRTRRLSFDAVASVQGDGEIWLDAEVHVNRADFGLTWNQMGMTSMNNTLTIRAVFTRR